MRFCDVVQDYLNQTVQEPDLRLNPALCHGRKSRREVLSEVDSRDVQGPWIRNDTYMVGMRWWTRPADFEQDLAVEGYQFVKPSDRYTEVQVRAELIENRYDL